MSTLSLQTNHTPKAQCRVEGSSIQSGCDASDSLNVSFTSGSGGGCMSLSSLLLVVPLT
jgi:hypothetical protein